MKRRAFLSACVAAAAGASRAQDTPSPTRRYAVLSLVGDQFNVVSYVQQVGRATDTNRHAAIALPDTSMDVAALRAADDALRAEDPAAKVSLLSASSQKQYDGQDKFFDGSRVVLPPDVLEPVRQTRSTHLVLITKRRGETRIEAGQGARLGSGYLEGIGFYIDRVTETHRGDTGQRATGFLAPFVYANASLIDLGSGSVVASAPISSTRFISAARTQEGFDPWDSLTGAQKVEVIKAMISKEVRTAVAELVKH